MTTITTKYNVNDSVYIVNYAKAVVLKATVVKVEITNLNSLGVEPIYRINLEAYGKDIKSVHEAELHTFAEAKTILLTYLNNKVTEITNLVPF